MRRFLNHPTVKKHGPQTLKFVIAGILGASMEFTIIYFLVGKFHLSPYFVYLPSAGIPALFVFTFNKYVTFRAMERTDRQAYRFLAVYSATFVLNYLLSSTFYGVGSHILLSPESPWNALLGHEHLAIFSKAAAIGVCSIINYFLSHFFIFKKSAAEAMVAL